MAEELAQPRIVTVKAGRESAYYPLYSRVDLQHKSLKIGLAHGVIKALVWNNSYLQKIILDGSVTFPTGTSCGVIINCVSPTGRGVLPLKVSGTGKTSELTVETTLRSNADVIPSAGNLLSFGELDSDGGFTTVTSQMLITNTEETDDGFNLTLIDYNDAIYEYGTLPTYKSNLTQRPNNSTKTISEQRDVATLGDVQATTSGAVQAAVDTVTTGYRFTNIYQVRPVTSTLDEIIAKIDNDARNSSASISMSEEEILIKVEDLDAQQRAYIDLTKDEILAEVDDMARELTGLIDVQAGAVTALVEGGGAAGQMSLSLNLPVMIDATKRAEFVTASTEAKVAAVYALVEGTTFYGIKGNASNAAVKALWDDAVTAGLIASQIVLSADQINIAGKTILTANKTTDIIDDKATDTYNSAKNYANGVGDSAQDNVAQKLGYADYAAMVTAASQGKTIIDGGYLRTSLIEVENLLADNITLRAEGYIKSSNYAEDSGGTPTAGFKIDAANNLINAVGGVFKNINVKGNSQIEGLLIQGTNVYFACRFAFYYYNGTFTIRQCSNPLFENRLFRAGTGQYVIELTDLPYRNYGTPRVICNYASDVAKTDRDVGNGFFGSGDFSVQGTNPKYRVQCSGVGVWAEYSPALEASYYTGVVFTDNNNDQFIDPIYADFLLVFV